MKQYSLNKKLIDDEKRWTLSGKDNTGQSFFLPDYEMLPRLERSN